MVLPYSRVAKPWRLSPSDLKKQALAQPHLTSQVPPLPLSFVEVPPAPEQPLSNPGPEIELQRADGARLRLRSGDATIPLAPLVRACLEAH